MTDTVVIAGGGIAGLTLALSLHAAGYDDVTVLERSASIRPRGSGINLMPQAVRELDGLGLLDDLREIAIETSELIYATHRGERIWREARGRDAGFRWPQLSIHRGLLQVCLADHVRRRLGAGAVRTNREVVSARGRADGVRVTYRDRDAGTEHETEAALLVGADGIRSAVRRVVAPDDGGPVAARKLVWRGTTRSPRFLDGRTMVIAGDLTHKVVFYPLVHHDDGTTLLNWAAAGPLGESGDETGNWDLAVDPESFAPAFDGWSVEGVDIAAMMRAGEGCFVYPMVDLDPLDRWTSGRITLAGDAAHAMYPVGSNGATQSIIDAAALAHHLRAAGTTDEGLRAYERDRRPVTRRIQAANRAQGPEVVVDLAAQRVPARFATVPDAFREGELEAISARYAGTTALDQANSDSPYQSVSARVATTGALEGNRP